MTNQPPSPKPSAETLAPHPASAEAVAAQEIANMATDTLRALGHSVTPNDLQAMKAEYQAIIDQHLSAALARGKEDGASMDWLESTQQRGHYCGIFRGDLLTRSSISAARTQNLKPQEGM